MSLFCSEKLVMLAFMLRSFFGLGILMEVFLINKITY